MKAAQARSESIGVWGRGWTLGTVLVQADPTLRDGSSAPIRRIVHFTSPISEKGGKYRSSHVVCVSYRRTADIAKYRDGLDCGPTMGTRFTYQANLYHSSLHRSSIRILA